MKSNAISPDRLNLIREYNEQCRLKNLVESFKPLQIEENVTVLYNGVYVDMPKSIANKLNEIR